MPAPPIISRPQQVVPLVSGHYNYESDVTALANGNSVITWSDWFNIVPNTWPGIQQRIFARMIDAYGNQIGEVITVDTVTDYNNVPTNHTPVITALTDGGFVIAFQSGAAFSDQNAHFRRYDSSGNPVTGNVSAAASPNSESINDTAGLVGGGWVVTYTSNVAGNLDVRADFYNAAGVLVADDISVGLNNADEQSNAQLAVLSNGNVVIAYDSYAAGNSDVYFRIVNSAGDFVRTDLRANTIDRSNSQRVGGVAALSNGGFAVVYADSRLVSLIPTPDDDVYVDIFDSSGAWVCNVAVDTSGGWQNDPSIVGLPDGTFAVTYSGPSATSAGYLHTRIYSNAGAYVGEVGPVHSTPAGNPHFSNMAVLSDGRIITTWTGAVSGLDVGYTLLDSRTRASDYGGNGTADLFWRNSVTGENVVWSMNGSTISAAAFTSQGSTLSSYWTALAGASDFDNNGRNDVLWRGTGGELILWNMNNATVSSANYITYNGNTVSLDSYWTVGGTGNFGGLPTSDILWRGAGGQLVIWDMNGTTINQAGYVTNGGNVVNLNSYWSVGGVADFSGDGRADVLWRGSGGELIVWNMNGSAIQSAAYITYNGNTLSLDNSWTVAGVGDFGGDGHADILWRQASSGSIVLWQMNGNQVMQADYVQLNGIAMNLTSYWTAGEVADFSGDGRMDILWRGAGNELVVWGMNGNNIATANYITLGGNNVQLSSDWTVV